MCPFARRLDALKYARAIDENARDANRGERSDVVADIVGTENKIVEFPRSLFDPVEMPFEDLSLIHILCYENPEGWATLMAAVDAGEDPGELDVESTAIIPASSDASV